MVTTTAATGLVLAWLAATPVEGGVSPEAVRSVLRGEGFPWYDAPHDTARPVWPSAEEEDEADKPSNPKGSQAGQSIVFVLMMVGVVAIVMALALSFRLYTPTPREPRKPPPEVGRAARLDELPLPSGITIDLDDPWAEARRLRQAGDLAGASVALFIHLVVTLDRRGLSRLATGRTARQLVRSVADASIRRRVEPTLRLFESVFYGHREPTPEAFESAWSSALALRHLWEEEAA